MDGRGGLGLTVVVVDSGERAGIGAGAGVDDAGASHYGLHLVLGGVSCPWILRRGVDS